jgi:hypothetical protein
MRRSLRAEAIRNAQSGQALARPITRRYIRAAGAGEGGPLPIQRKNLCIAVILSKRPRPHVRPTNNSLDDHPSHRESGSGRAARDCCTDRGALLIRRHALYGADRINIAGGRHRDEDAMQSELSGARRCNAAGIGRANMRRPSCRRASAPKPSRRSRRSGWPRPRKMRSRRSTASSRPGARHRTVRSKGCLSNKTALAMIFKLAEAAETSWRRLDGYNQLPKDILGIKFVDGIEVLRSQTQAAAA